VPSDLSPEICTSKVVYTVHVMKKSTWQEARKRRNLQ